MKLLVELGADLNVSQIGLARRLLLIHFRDSILQALSAGPLALVQASPVVENQVKQSSMMIAISFCDRDFTFGSSTV